MDINVILPSHELVVAAGKAPTNLLVCPNTDTCHQILATMWQKNTTYRYLLELQCTNCGTNWYVCTLCERVYTHYIDQIQAFRHFTQKKTIILARIIENKEM